jgi:hypothetical protein
MDGAAVFDLSESSTFEKDFDLFVNVISRSCTSQASIPFGYRIKLQAALRELATKRLTEHANLKKSPLGAISSGNKCLSPRAPRTGQTERPIPPEIASLPLSATATAEKPGQEQPLQVPQIADVTLSNRQQQAGDSDEFLIKYQTIDREMPVPLRLTRREATPAGLKRAIALAEGFDDYVADGACASESTASPTGSGEAAPPPAAAGDFDRWRLHVRPLGGKEDFAVLTVSNQLVRFLLVCPGGTHARISWSPADLRRRGATCGSEHAQPVHYFPLPVRARASCACARAPCVARS